MVTVHRLRIAVRAAKEYLDRRKSLKEVKPALKEAVQAARDAEEEPAAQAAARAVSTACTVLHSPTGALGFTFYGAAAYAYSSAGLNEKQKLYEELAETELKKILESLQKAAVPDEKNPVKINWNC